MRYLALGAAVAVLAAVTAFAFRDSDDVRSPREVVGAFVYHLDKGNFGKACGLLAQELRGDLEDCSSGLVYNAGTQMGFFGVDVYDGATLLPGSEKWADGEAFRIKTTALPPVEVVVVKQESGRYRITRIG